MELPGRGPHGFCGVRLEIVYESNNCHAQ